MSPINPCGLTAWSGSRFGQCPERRQQWGWTCEGPALAGAHHAPGYLCLGLLLWYWEEMLPYGSVSPPRPSRCPRKSFSLLCVTYYHLNTGRETIWSIFSILIKLQFFTNVRWTLRAMKTVQHGTILHPIKAKRCLCEPSLMSSRRGNWSSIFWGYFVRLFSVYTVQSRKLKQRITGGDTL